MPILSIVNQKGGSAKTTVSVHVVHAAIRRKQRVLAIDFDKQGSFSDFFDRTSVGESITASQCFAGPLEGNVEQVNEHLHIVRADQQLRKVSSAGVDAARVAATNIRALSAGYDLVLIDTAGALGEDATTIASLLAADYVLSPFGVGKFEASALAALWTYLRGIRARENTRLKVLGLLPAKINTRSKTEMQGLESLRTSLGNIVAPHILAERASVKQAIAQGVPVWQATKGEGHATAAKEWRAACRWVLDAMGA